MPKKRALDDQPRKCVTCGKTLPPRITYCVSCGSHDVVELDAKVADLDDQIRRSHERNLMMMWLSRLTFGLWRF